MRVVSLLARRGASIPELRLHESRDADGTRRGSRFLQKQIEETGQKTCTAQKASGIGEGLQRQLKGRTVWEVCELYAGGRAGASNDLETQSLPGGGRRQGIFVIGNSLPSGRTAIYGTVLDLKAQSA